MFAGEVFPEWYWGPIFFYLVFGLPLAAAALLVDLAVRRWVRRLSWPQRGALWVGVFAAGTLAILGGRAVIDHVRFEREAKAAAQQLDFVPYAAESLPARFDEEYADANDFFGGPVLISRYDVGARRSASSYQQRRPAELSLQDGRCDVHDLAGTGTSFFEGSCRALRSPRGRTVYLGTAPPPVTRNEAFALLDGTLARLQHDRLPDGEVLAYFDALRPVAPGDLDFKQG